MIKHIALFAIVCAAVFAFVPGNQALASHGGAEITQVVTLSSQPLGKETLQLLGQTLGALRQVLDTIGTRVNSADPQVAFSAAQRPAVYAVLGGIRESLLSIDAQLAGKAVAAGYPQAPLTAQTPAPAPVAQRAPEGAPAPATASNEAARQPAAATAQPAPQFSASEVERTGQTAVVAARAETARRWFFITLGIILLAGAAFYWWRERQVASEDAVFEAPQFATGSPKEDAPSWSPGT